MKQPELWTPDQEWKGQDAVIIGGGPSLKGFDFSVLAGKNVIGCNDAFNLGSEIVKFCIFGDHSWWQKNKWKLEKFQGRVVTCCPTVMPYLVPGLLKMEQRVHGLHSGSTLGWNYSTGAAAINLAVSLGAKRIYLLGYDLKRSPTDSSHWHDWNPRTRIHDSSFERFQRGFKEVRGGLNGTQVYNVTDGSSLLETFPRIDFALFKKHLEPAPKKGSK